MAYEILLVDDHKIMRDGIKAILQHTEEFRVVGEAENGRKHGEQDQFSDHRRTPRCAGPY